MKRKISDLMDQAAPVAVDLEENKWLSAENIKARTLEKVRAERTSGKKGRSWFKIALIAACCAALMAVTVGAGRYAVQYRFTQQDDRRMTVETVQPAKPAQPVTQAPATGNEGEKIIIREPADAHANFDQVYLPTVFPGEAEMKGATRYGSDSVLMLLYWEWEIDGKHQMIFEQEWADTVREEHHTSNLATLTLETGEVDMGGISVTYITTCVQGTPVGHRLLWNDEVYSYELDYGTGIQLEELEPVVLSLQPVEAEEYNALLEAYKTAGRSDRMAMQQVLLPGEVPQGLTFGGLAKEDSCSWYLENAEGYTVNFYQEDADSKVYADTPGSAGRRWDLQHNEYLVDVELAGRQVQMLGGDEEEYKWEYIWEQEGNWCNLRVDRNVAQQLGLDIPTLAERIIEGLQLVDAEQAEQTIEEMKK